MDVRPQLWTVLSPLEALPTEIVQQIFLLDVTVYLPLASPILAAKLSDDYIYTAVALDALFDLTGTGKPSGQKQRLVFSRRWMNWRFFKIYLAKVSGLRPPNVPNRGRAPERPSVPWPARYTPLSEIQFDRYTLSSLRCPIPTKLLHGPWTNDKLEFLHFLLRMTNMSVDRTDVDTRRLVALSKREAILERNRAAVELFNRNRKLGKAPNLNLVKFAVIDGGCDRNIVFECIYTAWEWGNNRWQDIELDQWIASAIAEGNPKGRWLELKLQEVRKGKPPNWETGDYHREGDILSPSLSYHKFRCLVY